MGGLRSDDKIAAKYLYKQPHVICSHSDDFQSINKRHVVPLQVRRKDPLCPFSRYFTPKPSSALKGLEPVENACGPRHADAVLAWQQCNRRRPLRSRRRAYRTCRGEGGGGCAKAPRMWLPNQIRPSRRRKKPTRNQMLTCRHGIPTQVRLGSSTTNAGSFPNPTKKNISFRFPPVRD